MASLVITVDDKGVTSIEVLVKSVADGVKAGRLTERTALAVRLLQQSAKADEQASTEAPIDFLSSGRCLFRCACGARFVGAWDAARGEAIAHVRLRHADQQMRNLDVEAITEALIVPNPLVGGAQQ